MKAFVVLPDHLHAMWELPCDDSDYSVRWRKLKQYFTLQLKNAGVPINKYHASGLWQRRY